MELRFRDRHEAGQFLASKLIKYANFKHVLVLALPRGGVPVGYEVAQALKAPLDIFVVRKLGVPGYEELAMGALATGGVRVLNPDVVEAAKISEQVIEAISAKEQREIDRRELAYRENRPPPKIEGRIVILVDDGLATGATMWAAVMALRHRNPMKIVVAVPTASEETCNAFRSEVDDIVCGITPEPFLAVGLWYENFSQISDEEVRQLLKKASEAGPTAASRR